jgi:hypothetical protein
MRSGADGDGWEGLEGLGGRNSLGGNSDGFDLADKSDIPSPVLTGQVQRVWISAGPMRGTPCQSSTLALAAWLTR